MYVEQSILTIGHRSYLEVLYYEYIYEHDNRLRMTRNYPPLLDDTQQVVMPDQNIAQFSKYKKESKFSEKSALRDRINKVLIYKRTSFTVKEQWRMRRYVFMNLQKFKRNNSILTIGIMGNLGTIPRKRWNKLYSRNPWLKVTRQTLSAEISGKMIQLQNFLPAKEPAKHRFAVCHFRENGRISRSLIYRRCNDDDDRCLPLIRNQPCSSEDFDEVSGQTLSHITLLCRDVICECNKCTNGCFMAVLFCDACILKYLMELTEGPFTIKSGSYAEDCLLPPFYVQNDENEVKEITSDIDAMIDSGTTVGFEGKDCNINATIETENSPPGYLKLRDIQTGKLFWKPCIWSIALEGETWHTREEEEAQKDKSAAIFKGFFGKLHYFQHVM